MPINIPCDRDGSFEPQPVAKHQTRWTGFDDKILSLYARGMTVREIQSHLEEMYGTEVSSTLISSVTDAVMEEVKAWQARPLDALYPIVYLDQARQPVRWNVIIAVQRQPGRIDDRLPNLFVVHPLHRMFDHCSLCAQAHGHEALDAGAAPCRGQLGALDVRIGIVQRGRRPQCPYRARQIHVGNH